MNKVTLIDGRILPVADVQLDSDGWNFSRISSGERLTYQLKFADKIKYFPNYNVSFGNDQIYQEKARAQGKDVGGPLPTNVTGIFAKQLVTDPLAAPADFAASAIDKVKKIASSPMTIVVTGLVVAGVAIFLISRYTPKP